MLPSVDVRIIFEKKDNAKYISHLDLQRAIRRAIERSGLEPKRTEGFNPHPKMNFSAPLSLYQESECEFLDMTFENVESIEFIEETLKKHFPPGLNVVSVAEPKFAVKKIKTADYEISFISDNIDKDGVKAAMSGEMVIMKKGKAGVKPVDISKQILSAEIKSEENKIYIFARVNASSESYLNPAKLVEFLDPDARGVKIVRTGFFTDSGERFS